MRILFLSSSLEPGRDGVGDYTRCLAEECLRQGHSCGMIALHDRHITEPIESAYEFEKATICWLRLPAGLSWSRRVELATAFRSRFQPDWISLQFVPYGLDDKGIVLKLSRGLRTLVADSPLHLMLHELWIGDPPASLRHRFIGFLQRLGVTRMVSILKPRLVTTSNPVYLTMLKSLGIPATMLPLFGSIPVMPMDSPPKLPTELVNAGIRQDDSGRDGWWLGIFFGGLHREWKPEPLMTILQRAAKQAGKRICLILAGRAGADGEVIWENLRRDYPADILLVKLGEQPVEKISTLLQIADFGIAASPWQLIGKSSAVAAMLDHGLPVIVTRDDFQPRLIPDEPPSRDPLFHPCNSSLGIELLSGLPRQPARARLGEIAAQFCRQLETATPHFS